LEDILNIEDVIGSDTRIIKANRAAEAVAFFERERQIALYAELPGGFTYYRGELPRC
jgi:hypothetical protein